MFRTAWRSVAVPRAAERIQHEIDTVADELQAPAGSTYQPDFTVDQDNMTREWNETNNALGLLTVIYGG